MNCPRDGSPLVRVNLDGIDLDKCVQCRGIWLDYGELARVCRLQQTCVEQSLHTEYRKASSSPGQVRGYMRCPVCSDGRLQQITYTYTNPIKIDRCDECLGIWVDASELDAIVSEKKQVDDEYAVDHIRDLVNSISSAVSSS